VQKIEKQLVELGGAGDGTNLPAVDFRTSISQDDDAPTKAATGHARTGKSADASPVVAQLERLEAKLHCGSITQSKFDEQKCRLLN
jgi:hypothetical protein